jgi:hypothetical protein
MNIGGIRILKYAKYVLISLLIFNPGFIFASEESAIGQVTFPLGEVKISHNQGQQWDIASLNCPVFGNSMVKTGIESRCEISLRDGSIIRLGEQSMIKFDNIALKTDRLQGEAKLTMGSLWTNLRKLKSGDKAIAVKTPTSVMAVRGTVFRTQAEADSATSILVYEGALDVKLTEEMEKKILPLEKKKPGPPKQVEGPAPVPGPYEVTLEQWMRIVAGMQINVRKDGKYHSFQFDPQKDAGIEWVKWNRERDAILK